MGQRQWPVFGGNMGFFAFDAKATFPPPPPPFDRRHQLKWRHLAGSFLSFRLPEPRPANLLLSCLLQCLRSCVPSCQPRFADHCRRFTSTGALPMLHDITVQLFTPTAGCSASSAVAGHRVSCSGAPPHVLVHAPLRSASLARTPIWTALVLSKNN